MYWVLAIIHKADGKVMAAVLFPIDSDLKHVQKYICLWVLKWFSVFLLSTENMQK